MSEPPQEPPQEPTQEPTQRSEPGEPNWQPPPPPAYGPPQQPAYGPPPQPAYGPPQQPPHGPPQQPPYGPPQQPAYGPLPQQPAYGPPPQQRPSVPLAVRLGTRLRVRPEPRFGVSLAAVGAALTILGGLIWTIGYYAQGLDVHFTESGLVANGESRRFLGFGLGLVLAVVGYLLLVRRRRGPIATAGAICAAIGVPVALTFVTLDVGGLTSGSFPVNLDVVYLVSILIWVVSYFLVPGARGRAFFLGLALLELPSYIEYKSAGDSLVRSAEVSTIGGGGFNPANLSTGGLTAVGLIFGLVYYAAAYVFDRRGMRGVSTPFVVAGFFTTLSGVIASVASFEQVGTGIELLVLGAALGWFGSQFGHRFTAWVWAAAIPVGVVVLVAKASPDNSTAAGIAILVIGLVVVAVASVVSRATNEAVDLDEPDSGTGATGAWPGTTGGYGGFGHPGAHV